LNLSGLGFVALKEAFKFIKENQSSVNIEQRMNELEGDVYALQGYTENENRALQQR
jgi:hypothetical protein